MPEGFGGSRETTRTQFGTRNNTSLSADLNQTIYKPTLTADIRLAEKQVEQQHVSLSSAKRDAAVAIAEAYLAVLSKTMEQKIHREYAALTRELAEVSERTMALGTSTENALLKRKLEARNAELTKLKAEQDYVLSVTRLKQELGLDETANILLSDSLNFERDFSKEAPSAQALLSNIPALEQDHLSLQTLALQRDKHVVSEERAWSGLLPSVSLNANYTYLFQSNDFQYGTNAWSPFSSVSLRVNVPIFNQLRTQDEATDYRLKSEQTLLELQHRTGLLRYKHQEAKEALENATRNVQYALENYTLSQKIYQTDAEQYRLGKLSYSEFVSTMQSKNSAESNYVQALTTAYQRQLSLRKIASE